MEITFEKLHGNGNDFILIDEFEKTVIPDEMKPGFARSYCDRRFGIGADGLVSLPVQCSRPQDAHSPAGRERGPDVRQRSRRFVKHAFDAGYVEKTCTVETGAGIR